MFTLGFLGEWPVSAYKFTNEAYVARSTQLTAIYFERKITLQSTETKHVPTWTTRGPKTIMVMLVSQLL
jgi:hypothetical protein